MVIQSRYSSGLAHVVLYIYRMCSYTSRFSFTLGVASLVLSTGVLSRSTAAFIHALSYLRPFRDEFSNRVLILSICMVV